MTSIIAEKNMVAALRQVKEFAQICDARGQIIGVFTPRKIHRKNNHAMTATRPHIDEIERRKRSKEKGEPWKVVRGRLRLLEVEIERRKRAGERKLTGDEAVAFIERLRKQSHAKKPRAHPSARKR